VGGQVARIVKEEIVGWFAVRTYLASEVKLAEFFVNFRSHGRIREKRKAETLKSGKGNCGTNRPRINTDEHGSSAAC
jgi:hypothetical protein